MTVALQRAQVKTIVKAVSGIGNVEDRLRFSIESKAAAEWFVRSGKVNGWIIKSKPFKPDVNSCAEQVRKTRYIIRGWVSFEDETSTRTTNEDLLQVLLDTLLAERTLNGTADNTSELDGTITDEPGLYTIGEGKYLCDQITVTFVAEEYVAIAYT